MEWCIEFNKWKHNSYNESELKDIAKKIYNNEIFTTAHCQGDTSSFMILSFIGPHNDLKTINDNDNDVLKRKKKFHNLEVMRQRRKYFKSKGTTLEKAVEDWWNDIGLVFESYDKAGTMAINGMPTFFSCKIMTKEDTKTMWNFFEEYKEMREKIDNF